MTDGTDRQVGENKHARGLALAEAGRTEKALAAVREHLLDHPADGEALNDAGVLLYGLGRIDEAVEHLKAAVAQLTGREAQPLLNLAEAQFAAGRADEAVELIEPLARAGALRPDVPARAAATLLRQGDPAAAVEALIRSADAGAEEEALRPLLGQVRGARARVGLFPGGGDGNFEALHGYLDRRFETRLCEGAGREEVVRLLQWCDVAWFERCDGRARTASQLPTACRIAVRLAPHEAYDDGIEQVDWANVDLLVTSGSAEVRRFLRGRLPAAAAVEHLPCGVDCTALPFVDRQRGTHLACLDALGHRQDPALLIHCLHRLRQADDRYRLSFAGQFENDLLAGHVRGLVERLGLADAVSFDGWQEDRPGWLADKHYVVSADMADAAPAVPEAMAMGLEPAVGAFGGAEELYPPGALFVTADDFCRRILDGPYDSRACRAHVERRFSMDAFLRRANELVVRLERLAMAAGPGAQEPPRREALQPASAADDNGGLRR